MNYIIFRRFGLFLITLLLFTSCSHSMPPKRQRAWIDERFADSIIRHSTIDGNLLFPIVVLKSRMIPFISLHTEESLKLYKERGETNM